jgi:hypothetical protein
VGFDARDRAESLISGPRKSFGADWWRWRRGDAGAAFFTCHLRIFPESTAANSRTPTISDVHASQLGIGVSFD